MQKLIVYPYKLGSESAKKLAQALNTKRVRPDGNYYHHRNHIIINWGNSTLPTWWQDTRTLLNKPYSISLAANKKVTFNKFRACDVPHPEWTDLHELAELWIEDGHKVFCRTSLTSHSGQGIVIASTVEELVDAPLYVKAVKKDKEYRVHVFNGQVIDFQLKKKKLGYEGGISGIRNHHNGWVYTREGVTLPDNIKEASINAVNSLALDFGAVDVCSTLAGDVAVFEVNTAPGLHGLTLTKYTEAFNGLLSR